MNKSLLTVAVTCLAFAGLQGLALAHEDEEQQTEPVYQQGGQRPGYQGINQGPRDNRHRESDRQIGGDGLDREVNHLNGMVQHVGARCAATALMGISAVSSGISARKLIS